MRERSWFSSGVSSAAPVVVAAIPSCYGTNLIRNLIPHELGGAVDLVFAPDGVSCKIEVPLEQI